MSASGYWCALILLTFTQDSLGSHYEKLQIEKPKEYLRHQQNHRSSFVDRKLIDPTGFRSTRNNPVTGIQPIRSIAESRPAEADVRRSASHRAEMDRATMQNRAEIDRPVAQSLRAVFSTDFSTEVRAIAARPVAEIRRAVDHLPEEEIRTTRENLVAETRSGRAATRSEILSTERHALVEPGKIRGVSAESRSREEASPTEVRPWTELEQAETSVERSQIRHGRSRSHFARQKIEDASKDVATGRSSFDRIKSEDQENRFKTRRPADYPEGPRNRSWLRERDSSKDITVNGQPFDRAGDGVPEGLESLLKLYQARRGNVSDESSTVSLMRNQSWFVERNFSKDNPGRFSERRAKNAAQKDLESALKTRHSENHGVLRSSPDSLKDLFKDDSLSKLRKAMSSNKTIDRNTTETIDAAAATAEDTSESSRELEEAILQDVELDYTSYEEPTNASERGRKRPEAAQVDIVTRFLRIIENQHTLGENCTAGTDLNLGEGVVDQYAQERFRLEANLAVNRANMLTRLWKYAPEVMLSSEYLLHASVLSMVEFDEDIFAAGNCYDKLQYRDRWLYCPFAHRLPNQDGILVKDLAIEYKYLTNSSEWFYIARKNAERVIATYEQFSRGKLLLLNIVVTVDT